MHKNIYTFSAQTIQGTKQSLEHYEGKLVLIVNTASKCGLTPQYKGLEELYNKYKNQGLVILGFPCNQFGAQEPGDESTIVNGCLLNYGVSFPMFSKIKVNGEQTHPLYKYLKAEQGGIFGDNIKWNFTKFLVNKEGKVIKRFAPTTTPEKIEKFIQKLL